MLEELLEDKNFDRICDDYFSELGYKGIFTKSYKHIEEEEIKNTLKNVYS